MAEEEVSYSDFLNSDIVWFQTAGSSRKFSIHAGLLVSRCKAIHAAFLGDFKENKDGVYTVQDTTDKTVIRFIEWAYTKDYSNIVEFSDVASIPKVGDEKCDTPSLLSHARVCIFAHVYAIQRLESLAYDKLTAIIALKKPKSQDARRTIIHVLDTVFSRLPENDRLLDWLCQYAAWRIEDLKLEPESCDVLPKIAASMLWYMLPATNEPQKISMVKKMED
ncbi:hypothetical protein AOQ84DRAFT_439926 [Glonium stellatum]|uniref:BTB domain-containing protein n=1 Tax=Glonium stellatum TaxID=574774 RepID=A0A8E2F058_9PEZI|nr:hypothetical protein AOQ84DRAFT_439926 [Glonium stellatum]